MRKGFIVMALTTSMMMSLFTGCAGSPSSTSSSSSTAEVENSVSQSAQSTSSKPVTINIFQNAPEYTDAMNEMFAEYKKSHPNVTINFETTQSDYSPLLKTKLNSGTIPDVFATAAGQEIKAFSDYALDLSDQPLAGVMLDNLKDAFSYNGKLSGIPFKCDAFGIIYNKDMFKKAGITEEPKTISQLEEACNKLKAVGIQPFTTGFKEWWVNKQVYQHFVNAAQPDDVRGLVEKFISGKERISNYPVLTDNWFKIVDMVAKYGDVKPLETDLSAEISAFGSGKAAMIFGQGTWVESDILKIDENAPIGFMGWPVSEDPKDCKIIVGSDIALRINKNSPVKDQVLDLYNWFYTSDYGKKWFSDVAKVIPPIKDVGYPDRPIAKRVEEICKTETPGVLANIFSMESFHNKFGEIMQGYYAGTTTKEKAIPEIEKAWTELGESK